MLACQVNLLTAMPPKKVEEVEKIDPDEVTEYVKGGSQRWLYNKLLAVFSERCRSTVQAELEQAAQRGIGTLSTRVQESIKAFTAGGGVVGAPKGASTSDSDGAESLLEPEPEPDSSFDF